MSRREHIQRLTQEMVEVPSVTGEREENLAVLDLVDGYLGGGVKLESKTFERKGVVSRLWGDPDSLMNPRLLMCGHVDVVDGDSGLFKPRVEDGRMYGRGTGDMKGNVAAMVDAYKRRLVEEGGPGGVGLLLVSDEEVGGFDGARYVVEEGLRAPVVFIPDGTAGKDFDIDESQKAPHHFTIRALGEGGHASLAFEIDNPVNRIWRVYTAMRAKYGLATPQHPWQSTFEMSVIHTDNFDSRSANRIPAEVYASFSWRWPLEHFEYEEGVADMERWCAEHGCEIVWVDEREEEKRKSGERIWKSHGLGEGMWVYTSRSEVQMWKGVIEEIIGREVGFAKAHGAADARHFYQADREAAIIVTQSRGGGFHNDGEWVDIESLVQLSEAIYRYQKLVTK